MWYPATVKVPPSTEPVTLPAARQQCGIADGDTSHDLHLTMLIAAARMHVEKHCCIRVPKQVVTVPCDGFADLTRLPEAPVRSVVAIQYIDLDGAPHAVAVATLEERLDGLRPSIVLAHGQAWPSIRPGSRVTVELEVGYEAPPKDLEAAMLLIIAAQFSFARSDLLKRREDVEGVGSTQWGGVIEVNQAVKNSVDSFLENYRCWPLS